MTLLRRCSSGVHRSIVTLKLLYDGKRLVRLVMNERSSLEDTAVKYKRKCVVRGT